MTTRATILAERAVSALEHGRTAWLLPVIAAVLAVGPALSWAVPDERGIPFAAAWIPLAIIGTIAAIGVRGRRPTPLEVTFVIVAAAVLLGVVTLLPTQPLRDLDVYLRAGSHWLAGQPVYLDHHVTEVPVDRSLYPFHYPPLTLPLFGALAALPREAVHVLWLLASAGLALLALRAFAIPWSWALAALLWRPFAEGLWVGNVAVPLLAAFALAPRAGALLAVPGLFKVYAGLPAVWLIRERRWRDVALAVAVGIALALVTLPLVGVAAWREWLAGLAWWDASIPALGSYATGIALGGHVGLIPALAIAATVLVLALRARGDEALWRLGVATPVISPAVFSHGLLTTIPALLELRTVIQWLAIAATAAAPSPVFWLAPAMVVASWLVPVLRRPTPGAMASFTSGAGGIEH